MNNEIIFLHLPKYIVDKNFMLTEEELRELDFLAELMQNVDNNFNELMHIWKKVEKYRVMTGGMN